MKTKTTLSLSLIIITSLLLQACAPHHHKRGAYKAKHIHHKQVKCHAHPRLNLRKCHRH